jgi:hypothetical protein
MAALTPVSLLCSEYGDPPHVTGGFRPGEPSSFEIGERETDYHGKDILGVPRTFSVRS